MKIIFWFIIITFSIFSCGTYRGAKGKDKIVPVSETQDTIHIENKELEYEIIIIDVGFDSWLVTQKPITYYSNQTLRNYNYFYVTEWNLRVTSPLLYDTDLYEYLIDYQPNIDYGKEVNYTLYMYFQFFQKRYHQNLYGYGYRFGR